MHDRPRLSQSINVLLAFLRRSWNNFRRWGINIIKWADFLPELPSLQKNLHSSLQILCEMCEGLWPSLQFFWEMHRKAEHCNVCGFHDKYGRRRYRLNGRAYLFNNCKHLINKANTLYKLHRYHWFYEIVKNVNIPFQKQQILPLEHASTRNGESNNWNSAYIDELAFDIGWL